MSLKLWLLATFLVGTGCSNPDIAACGPDGVCMDEEPKAQNAAQGLLAMGSLAFRPLENQEAVPAPNHVKLDITPAHPAARQDKLADTPALAVPVRQPPRKLTMVLAHKKTNVSGPKPLPILQNKIVAPSPLRRPLHDSDSNGNGKGKGKGKGTGYIENENVDEDLDENLGENLGKVLDEDLDEDLEEDLDEDLEGADSDVVQTVKDTMQNEACEPCQFALYAEKDCSGSMEQAIDLECEGLPDFPDCMTKHFVNSSIVSIKASRKNCGIRLNVEESGERQRFAKKFEENLELYGERCVNIETRDGTFFPTEVTTRDRDRCRPRRRRRGNTGRRSRGSD